MVTISLTKEEVFVIVDALNKTRSVEGYRLNEKIINKAMHESPLSYRNISKGVL